MGIITNYGYKGFTYVQGASPPSDAKGGDTWLDHSSVDAYVRDNDSWVKVLELTGGSSGAGDTGLFGGGYNRGGTFTHVNVIETVTISSTGDATDFGDLTTSREASATSNGTSDRGIFGPWNAGNVIDYVTISTPGNATDFGDFTSALDAGSTNAMSNGTSDRGIFGGGPSYTNVIEYVTISSAGNATDFGDLTVARQRMGGCSNGTSDRGVFGGGIVSGPSQTNVMDYITISSAGNASDFGDLTTNKRELGGTSNDTDDRGLFGGGWNSALYNIIDYVTISSTGNATDFGDLTLHGYFVSGTSNGVDDRGIWGGRYNSNVIDYVTISSAGNASDFGDLSAIYENLGATSNGQQ